MSEPTEREVAIFNNARRLEGSERTAYLSQACAGDPGLLQRLGELLGINESAGEFLEKPALGEPSATPLPAGISRSSDSLSEKPGDRIGPYKLLQEIGEGGCGVVYMAEQQEPIRRRVALKVIKLGMDTRQVVGRFEAERQALALMDHPNIAKVLDAGITQTGRPYFAMELVRGVKITEYCDRNNVSTEERLNLFVEICRAVQHAHQKGIIHRDIKPSNILVTLHDGKPVPKVIDFGIAKATGGQTLTDRTLFTAFEQFIGTPAYMSPEQAEMSALDIDTRSDIYSLGVLLYELLTGKTPFDPNGLLAKGIEEMRRAIREEEPRRPSTRLTTMEEAELTTTAKHRQTDPPRLVHLVRGDLDWIVMKCLEKDRTRRYDTANGLAFDLLRHLNNEPVLARPPSSLYRLQKMAQRNKTAFAAATLIAVVLVVATGISVWQAVLAKQRLAESEGISRFLTEVFQSPDPARVGRKITVAEALGAAARKMDTELASQPARRAKLQATLGRTYHALGLDADAIPLEEKVRDYYLATSGLENTDTLMAMHNLAVSYYAVGRREEALKLREQALPLFRKVLGPEDPATLWAMHTLATSYVDVGRRDEALKLREQVLASRRKTLGPEHPDTLDAMSNLAISYNQAGRRDEALKLREQVLALYSKVLGPEQPDTLMAMNNLANSYRLAGRRDEALKLREQVLALRRKVLGPEHPDTLMAMNNLATSYVDAGRRDEALNLREQTLALYKKVLGPEHPDTLRAMDNLANLYQMTGRRGEALTLREQTLALSRNVLGPDAPETLVALSGLSDSCDESGRREEALKQREQLLALRRKVLGLEHPDTLRAIRGLATSYDEAGRRDEALKLREEVTAMSRKKLGPEHPDTLDAMDDLAVSYDEAGRRAEALTLQEQALALRRKALGPEHSDTLWAALCLAKSYDESGRHSEAVALLDQTCEAAANDTEALLTLAAWQAWLGQDAYYETTCRRLFLQAEQTDQALTAERAARAACLRPSTNAALLAKALDLAKRAVELGKSDASLPWCQLALGVVEYRTGQYADAERTLAAAEQNGGQSHDIPGTARLFEVLSLFRQNRPEDARKLFSRAKAEIPPPPPDDGQPLANGKPIAHDVLICWLAYKETVSLLGEPVAAKP